MNTNYRPIHPIHECLVDTTHEPHDWWYTSSGGGHQLNSGWVPDHGTWDSIEKNVKKWHCPGKTIDNLSST